MPGASFPSLDLQDNFLVSSTPVFPRDGKIFVADSGNKALRTLSLAVEHHITCPNCPNQKHTLPLFSQYVGITTQGQPKETGEGGVCLWECQSGRYVCIWTIVARLPLAWYTVYASMDQLLQLNQVTKN